MGKKLEGASAGRLEGAAGRRLEGAAGRRLEGPAGRLEDAAGRETAAAGVGAGSWVSPVSATPVPDLPMPALCGRFLRVVPAAPRVDPASLPFLYFNQHRSPS